MDTYFFKVRLESLTYGLESWLRGGLVPVVLAFLYTSSCHQTQTPACQEVVRSNPAFTLQRSSRGQLRAAFVLYDQFTLMPAYSPLLRGNTWGSSCSAMTSF